jgi:hypothetical protein
MGTPLFLPAPSRPYAVYWAESGGKGSFRYDDTSRWGPGELRDEVGDGLILIPGTGGGATIQRRVPGSIYGGGSSYRNEGSFIESGPLTVPGSSPHGVVVVRLTRIGP